MKKPLIMAAVAASLIIPSTGNAQSRDGQRDRQEIRSQKQDIRQSQRHKVHKAAVRSNKKATAAKYNQRPRYNSFRVGSWISRDYYGARQKLANYRRLGLPYAGANRRYVRYKNDVLLINLRTGSVVKVHRHFFS